ncbi:MAG: LuxR C-terminal-related transcriptional regulator [Actinomycetota bacterium]
MRRDVAPMTMVADDPTDTTRPALVERVQDAVVDSDGTPGRSVVLRGPAGIGKSHVARAVVEQLARTGHETSVVRVAGSAAARSLSFGSLLPLLPVDADPIAVEFELVQRLRAVLVPQQVTNRVVVVDDVGFVDEKSAGLLELLLRQGDVVVLATERAPLTGPPDEHDLSRVLRELAEIIDVPPMGDEELADLIQEWAGPGEVGSVRRIVDVGRGNPLVARELLSAAEASGSMAERDGLWFLDGFHPRGHTIERLVGEHLARLDEHEWGLVRCISVAESLPRTVLERIDGRALERLERSGVLAGSPVGVGHPLYGEVTRAAMTFDESREICRKLLGTVHPDDDIDAAQLGSWLLTAGDVVDDEVARAGARRALARWENELAADLLGAVSEPASPDLVQLQWAHANCGRLDVALEHADRAVESAVDEAERVDAVLARSELLCLQLGRADDGHRALNELRSEVTDADSAARIDGAIALYSHMTGNRALAGEAISRVRDLRLGDDVRLAPDAEIAMTLGDAFGHVFAGRFSAATPLIETGRRLAEEAGERHNSVRFDVVEALSLLFLGDLGAAGRLVDDTLRRADVSGQRPAHVVWLGLASQIAQLEGRFGLAERRDREAVRAADHVDDLGAGGFVRGDLAALAAEFERSHDLDPKSSAIGLARRQIRDVPAGDADSIGAELTRTTLDGGYVLWAPWVAREAVRRGPAPQCARLLIELADRVEGPLVEAMSDHAQGVVDGDLERVEASARAFLEHRCVMPALDAGVDAVAIALRVGPSVPLRRALLEFSRVMALVTPEVPPRLAGRFHELEARAEMPSVRQLEIATLAAAGSTSKEIAADLHLSARTVDNHLAAVYRSLGVSSRDELAELGLT